MRLLVGLLGAGLGAGVFRWVDSSGEDPIVVAASSTTTTIPTNPSTSTATTTLKNTTTTEPPTTTTEPDSTTTTWPTIFIPVICRDAWRAKPAEDGMEHHTIVRLTVHHTAAPITDVSKAPNHILVHQAFHQNTKGWPDIAYHFLVDPGGNIYQGRDPAYRGDTATEYDPTGHFLVCLDGDLDQAKPTMEQISAVVDLLAYGAMTYSVDPSTLGGHRDYASTSCPGTNVYSMIEDGTLEKMTRNRLGEGDLKLDLICGENGAQLVAEIEN